ncbi:MAG TPA: hypothetical protein VNI83_13670 [Vicinamibacterales bacterium]|nr:hypothetical protein [Vicinamibacterales bacterium]
MPYRDPDPDDPHVLIGVPLTGTTDDLRTMATVLAEEFVQLSYGRDEILGLFSNPLYRVPHNLYRTLGREAVVAIVDEVASAWEGFACRVEETQPPAEPLVRRDGRLKVLP